MQARAVLLEVAEFWRISWGRVRDAVAQAGADVTQWDHSGIYLKICWAEMMGKLR